MLNLNETNKYNLFTQGVDMRKGIESLCGIVHTTHQISNLEFETEFIA